MKITIEESGFGINYEKFQKMMWEFNENKTFVIKIGEFEFKGKVSTIEMSSEKNRYNSYRIEKMKIETVD